ncbi:DNA-binding transcriptional regulator LsrR (DeoR family) [Microbacterium marinum]|uniref:DNA-binding transcriptional regulator LsrR (DeoR family) n=1 Tax=Microbacterium marinum TaxID=421115 RepID=A0A7W7BR28_9MICO|nr:sugar-binding domain-containing protein [Microbacterium marinum]MBB4666286.1 DNA-binding transcriptional regulator LsrR (DeoR family) [Microbacterium marinum]
MDKAAEALRAAQLYYVQGAGMAAIADEMRISRSSVSRLLAYARDSGLVEITVHSPQEDRDQVAGRIAHTYGVRVHIVPTPSHVNAAERLDRTARSAARLVALHTETNTVIGIAWGATLSAVSRHLPKKPLHGTRVVQLNGAANESTSGVPYSSSILQAFAEAFGATTDLFPVPALFDDPQTKRAMWRERAVRSVLDVQARASVIIFGLGSPRAEVPSHVYSGEYLSPRDLAELSTHGVVGDCATVFFRADGSTDDIPLNERSSGPSFDTLRAAAHRICVISSGSKLAALRGALAADLITDLVIEESAARMLVRSAAGAAPGTDPWE